MMFGGRPSLTAAQQFRCLQANPLCAGAGDLFAGQLVWVYETTPSPFGRAYVARIVFRQDGAPVVFIDAPNLTLLAEGRRIPHVYRQDPTELCLYLPGAFQWSPWMRIDQTIAPWVMLWLYFFEDWLWSGEWRGGGEHPTQAAPGLRPERRRAIARRPA
jgi:hypothetical protein